ncbi:hypothetical protein OBBRIDRAFT_387714 [Obba rivulosa]|uniref:Uncharacterized protein n=1 Tax=Obba rivulosa TaxID=1052685 RepID=A0A8E2B359_9APHY|nr:hypothetical protein OBBRIDRAFT_387714 [Obba rivulosa]
MKVYTWRAKGTRIRLYNMLMSLLIPETLMQTPKCRIPWNCNTPTGMDTRKRTRCRTLCLRNSVVIREARFIRSLVQPQPSSEQFSKTLAPIVLLEVNVNAVSAVLSPPSHPAATPPIRLKDSVAAVPASALRRKGETRYPSSRLGTSFECYPSDLRRVDLAVVSEREHFSFLDDLTESLDHLEPFNVFQRIGTSLDVPGVTLDYDKETIFLSLTSLVADLFAHCHQRNSIVTSSGNCLEEIPSRFGWNGTFILSIHFFCRALHPKSPTKSIHSCIL